MTIRRELLELNADRIEATMAAHRAPGSVIGGTVGPRLIRFFVQPAPQVRFASIRRLADDIALALRVPEVEISKGREGVAISIANPNPHPIKLKSLLDDVGRHHPVSTGLLGLTEDGSPLLARLASPEVAHVLIAGTTGSGKSTLLKTLAASLAWLHRPDLLKLLIIDPKGQTFRAFGDLPHLVRPPVYGEEMLEALRSLVQLMEWRDRRGENKPRVVVLIDELADLVMAVPGAEKALTRLVQRARSAGIHLVAATQRPAAAVLSGLMKANFPVRVVGRVTSAQEAHLASGQAGTNAHMLLGRGDFVCVSSEGVLRFQGPHVTDTDLQALLGTRQLPLPDTQEPVTLVQEGHTALSVTVEEEGLAPRVAEAVKRLRPNWPEIRRGLEEGDVSKSALVRSLWGEDKSYAGSFARWLDAALSELATSTSTSTTSTTPFFSTGRGGIAA